ncbi:NAD(P)H-dependent glycerol-3-phosphate dehydrogenase [Mycoplasmopsis cynos]|nr:NAD(P)H-dependent glycerol-3-phosphate dehydrogenase [Mycoplasmopsis cynos]MCU9935292.1 NAD(P)-binding domain-containing protein [Mycoplasmopsis cynos]TQC54530.1 glycerol-3-phosphate dehydrogenase [Mycoplasmopsis cynos]UWV80505.1 NAD(P)-binding domain-containing protein [Mycoplasmopsis cynos]WAM05996.1 NAD(P)-binding domain-containing protein [Mycoplasmopsis cynos]WQQ13188.1 NAD(P)H-dependent glycerol-3-phosphate dehydrogenase [Mycoplasmopsis cynos]
MQKKYKFGFIGTGAFGSALANVLTTNNHKVIMYGINEQEVRNINNGNNRKYFENSEFTNPELISATMNFEYLVDNSEILMLALPSIAINDTLATLKKIRPERKYNIINLAKSFEKNTKMFYSTYIKEYMKDNLENIATFIGPSFANELFNKKATIINVFGNNPRFITSIQKYFNNEYFRLRVADDALAAELFASLKNVLAIGVGILSYFDDARNTNAAFLTIGIKEILKIYKALAKTKSYKSVADFATFGDLILTCSSTKSRNFCYGLSIAQYGIIDTEKNFEGTIEGKFTAKILEEILKVLKIKTTIFWLIINILNNKIQPNKILSFLAKSDEIV